MKPQRYGRRSLTVLLLVIPLISLVAIVRLAWAADTDMATPASDWLSADYEPLKSLKAVPAAVLTALLLKMPYDPRLADRGERFNVTDVIDTRWPGRRFAFGGKSLQFVLVCYEHGGYAPHDHIVIFSVAHEKPELVFAGILGRGTKTIDGVKALVQQGKVENKINAEHQEW